MPAETVKYRRKNACSGTLAASFGDPVLCPGLMDAAQKNAMLGSRDEGSCEMSVTAAANATEGVART
jgi:hypothetical protein